ncbi:MAG TPA: response regulator transcription factor [Roseateles sp.]|nr:response regulator transcription factor [Roseateles sp.]
MTSHPVESPGLPRTLALVDDDRLFAESLARYLGELGIAVSTFSDGADLLASGDPYAFDFYLADLMLPTVDGFAMINVLRRRTRAGILVVSGRLDPDTFKLVVKAGADMYLAKPVQFEQVAVAIEAVQRRAGAGDSPGNIWRLDRRIGQLVAPDGARIDLSEQDRALMECFVQAQGEVVSRELLVHRLGKTAEPDAQGGLNGTIFRLRRRIERATDTAVPLQAKSGVGYSFRAPLKVL